MVGAWNKLEAGCAFINCARIYRIARILAQALRSPQSPIIGDEVAGGGDDHAPRIDQFVSRTRRALDRTYQLNFGGNNDFPSICWNANAWSAISKPTP